MFLKMHRETSDSARACDRKVSDWLVTFIIYICGAMPRKDFLLCPRVPGITTDVHVLSIPEMTKAIIDYLLETSSENHCDGHGYTYFHAACLANHAEAVQRFISAGVDVNLDSWRLSPLQVAVHYRRPDIVRILLENGADPNRLDDRGRSTALHALAHRRVCDCSTRCRDQYSRDEDRPINAILDLLIAKGMNIEVPNCLGLTALQRAVSHLDYELARSLLKRGASLDPLSKYMSFNIFFKHELINYPVIFHFVEMIRLLVANGLVFDLNTRLEMLKFWIEMGSEDTEVFIPEVHVKQGDFLIFDTVTIAAATAAKPSILDLASALELVKVIRAKKENNISKLESYNIICIVYRCTSTHPSACWCRRRCSTSPRSWRRRCRRLSARSCPCDHDSAAPTDRDREFNKKKNK
ncbi:unnamed protein product [Trichogramma brassicae]|uniref:Uncharacterized protein n=1 Tax=Trichogramma brassicae TaxID=86971 RepID=A0A6H5IFQ0_9HYME|nr:unnamed protein product [Trichogramma brassicae]